MTSLFYRWLDQLKAKASQAQQPNVTPVFTSTTKPEMTAVTNPMIVTEVLKFPKLDRTHYYAVLKAERLFVSIKQSQIDGMNFILDGWEKSELTDLRWLAYMLATAYHETARTMQPIAEYGKGKGRPYGKKVKMSRKAYTTPNQIYYGRGYVQLTWYENYELMGKLLKVDILTYPELAMQPDTAFKIMLEGMTKGKSNRGDFTGRTLEQYFNGRIEDPKGARKIINGTDKDTLIAGYYWKFKKALVIA